MLQMRGARARAAPGCRISVARETAPLALAECTRTGRSHDGPSDAELPSQRDRSAKLPLARGTGSQWSARLRFTGDQRARETSRLPVGYGPSLENASAHAVRAGIALRRIRLPESGCAGAAKSRCMRDEH